MNGLLEGKAALVTGAASGIGRATAFAFAREGARVMLADIDEAGGRSAAATITDEGGDARFAVANVTSEASVEALVAETVGAFGRLDCAVNNAGMTGVMGPLHQLPLKEFQRVLDLNLTGVFLSMKYEIPAMQSAGGAIVNMASGAALMAAPALSAYCASKHAVLGLTKTAAMENARSGIRINAICPGSTDTPMLQTSMAENAQVKKMILAGQPGGRLGTPDEIAEAAVWLCSDRASFVTGHSMLVDGGAVAR
ncbi:MAG: glucose 1-dehydrogenase [Deltaproteobacteria bacterium]|nr:glucose 1-dehydrogenase [Deltaproteobacteria bacterium]MBW2665468.1 glucose 1-dehydrogenase [Deltaproteobacteria bacterium]